MEAQRVMDTGLTGSTGSSAIILIHQYFSLAPKGLNQPCRRGCLEILMETLFVAAKTKSLFRLDDDWPIGFKPTILTIEEWLGGWGNRNK